MEGSALENVPLFSKRVILVTVHRRENHGSATEQHLQAIRAVAERYRDTVHLVLPSIPIPTCDPPFGGCLDGIGNVTLTPPLGYRELIALAQACHFAMIDSGGLQEELPCLPNQPWCCATSPIGRELYWRAQHANWVEANAIIAAFTELMENPEVYQRMAQRKELFGDGFGRPKNRGYFEGNILQPFNPALSRSR